MLSYILQFTVCLSAFYLLYILVLSKETFFAVNRWYLLGTLILSGALPLLPDVWSSPQSTSLVASTIEPIVIGIQDVSTTLQPEASRPLWLRLLLLIYWFGVSVLLVRFALGLHGIWRIYQSRESMSFDGAKHVIFSHTSRVPFSFFHWIFLPVCQDLDSQDLQEIIAHETAHARALHSVDVLLMELACILMWPSPVVYFYRQSLRRVHEYLADAAVLERTPVGKYGRLLISQAAPAMQLALANHFFQNQLKHRIMMMTRSRSQRVALLKYAAVIPVVLIALALVAFKGSEHPAHLGEVAQIQADSVPHNGEILKVAEEMPRFPGCENVDLSGEALQKCAQKRMLEFIYSRVKYPASAREHGIEGNVVSRFVITSDGTVRDIAIVRSLDPTTDEAVLAVLRQMPKWEPGYQDGEPVNVELTLPVSFRLSNAISVESEATEELPESETTPSKPEAGDEVYRVVEEMPRFPGCEDITDTEDRQKCANEKLFGYITEHLKYSEEAKKAGVTGRSIVTFVIRADGSATDPKVVKSIGYGMDKQIVELVSTMPRWTPGKQGGKTVDVRMTLPVSFALPLPESVETRESRSQEEQAMTVEVFPVPTNEQLNYAVDLTEGSGEMTIELIASNGRVLRQEERNVTISGHGSVSGQLDIKGIAPGTYAVRISWDKQAIVKSVVIQ